MEYKKLTEKIIGCAYRVYTKLGFGFLESVYEKCLIIALRKEGMKPVGLLLNFGESKIAVKRKVREFRER